jgi:hypothetical protein
MLCRVSLCLAADASFRDTLQLDTRASDDVDVPCTILHVVLATTTGVSRHPRNACLPCPLLLGNHPALPFISRSLLDSIIQKHCEIQQAHQAAHLSIFRIHLLMSL